MAAPKWQAGYLYLPGDIVQAVQTPPATNQQILNPGFESGDVNWTKTNFTIVNEAGSFAGGWHAKMVYAAGANGSVKTAVALPISPGQSVTASCMLNPSGAADQVGGQIRVIWLTAADVPITPDAPGNQISVSNGSGQRKSTVTAVAPATAAKFTVQGEAFILQAAGIVRIDAFTLAVSGGPSTGGLVFKAVQVKPGTSGNAEPVWPTTSGVSVTDNEVTWQSTTAMYVKWKASPILTSGATQPTWPTSGYVSDGTISWEPITRRVEDSNCPNSKEVVIIASKVFAADGDIVRFSATANPLDWTTADNAGFIPTGLQSANANSMAVLNQYRGNLVGFNASSFQNWQADPDPAAMALLDQMEGIGSTWNKAAQPVANDLFYLSQLGVRSVGIAAGADNLSAGDIGMPIDVLVRAKVISPPVREGVKPLATYYPSAGQYWLAFRDCGVPAITGDLPGNVIGAAVSYQYTIAPSYPGQVITMVLAGTLPAGLSISAGGLVTGTITAGGTYSWTVTPASDCGSGTALADSATIASWYAVSYGSYADGTYAKSPGTDWSAPLAQAEPGALLAASFKCVAVGAGRTLLIGVNAGRTSLDDGATWASMTGLGTQTNNDACYGTSAYLVAGNASIVKRSTNGLAFTEITVPGSADNLYGVAQASATLACTVGYWGHASVDNGLTWTTGASFIFSSTEWAIAVGTDGTKLIATSSAGRLATSPDGKTWTLLTSPFAGVTTIDGIAHNGTYWVIGNANGEIAYSLTGADGSWTISGFAFGAAIKKITARRGAGLIVAVGASGKIATATNPATWTARANSFGTNTITGVG